MLARRCTLSLWLSLLAAMALACEVNGQPAFSEDAATRGSDAEPARGAGRSSISPIWPGETSTGCLQRSGSRAVRCAA
jgi:hypothetical protein